MSTAGAGRSRLPDAVPGTRTRRSRRHAVLAVAFALGAPVLVSLLLVPFRDSVGSSTAMLMLLVVMAAAVVGGRLPGVLAAIAASISYDVLLTEPYGTVEIQDAQDLADTLVLLIGGVGVGIFANRARRSRSAAAVRQREITVLTDLIDAAAGTRDPDVVIEHARTALEELLPLRQCEWRPGYHGTAGPVLRRDGRLDGAATDEDPGLMIDPIHFPVHVELPILGADGQECGRFVLRSLPGQVVSLEERRAAASVGTLVSHGLARHRR
jgi:hypothetical protein